MRCSVLWLSLLLGLVATGGVQAQDKVKVEVFYETLNGAVRTFFVDHLRTVVDHLWDSIDVSLVPYGRTVYNDTSAEYQCFFPDGQQCEANKLHACTINYETGTPEFKPKDVVEFAWCFFKNREAKEEPTELAESCLKDFSDDWLGIRQCLNATGAEDPTEGFRTATKEVETEIQVDGLVVRINGKASPEAKTDLFGQICAAISGETKPEFCGQPVEVAKVPVSIFYEAGDVQSGEYFAQQLGPYYHVLEDYIQLDLVPYGNTNFDAQQGYTCNTTTKCISTKFQALMAQQYLALNGDEDLVTGTNRLVNFITCLFKQSTTVANEIDQLSICSGAHLRADSFAHTIEMIKDNSTDVLDAMEAMRKKTEAIGKLDRLPTVAVGGQVDWNGLNDLVHEVCNKYTGAIKPQLCTKVKVAVIYQALHHKSRTLMLETIAPAFKSLYNLIDFEFLPAGKAKFLGASSFECPNGIDQCDAQILQICALDEFWNDGANYTDAVRQEVFDFLWCVTKNKRDLGVFEAAEICADSSIGGLEVWSQIHACQMFGEGKPEFIEYIERTKALVPNILDDDVSVPLLVIDPEGGGQEILDITNATKLIERVCERFDEYHRPDVCFRDPAAKIDVNVYYDSHSYGTLLFFARQLPWYKYVEEMINLRLYPAGNTAEQDENGKCTSNLPDSTCLANKIQAVVVDTLLNKDDDGDYVDGTHRTVLFLQCLYEHPKWDTDIMAAGEKCAENLPNDEWQDIWLIAQSEIGSGIYKEVVDKTTQFKQSLGIASFDLVPWVTEDTHHSKAMADDLLRTLCRLYQGELPPECTPVQVDIYYKALSPYNRRYFLEQVFVTFWHLRERTQFNLIPYGETYADTTVEQDCEAQPKVCEANKHQACAIQLFFDQTHQDTLVEWDGINQTMAYIHCMFKNIENTDVSTLSEVCALKHFILADQVKNCVTDGTGLKYLKEMHAKTTGLVHDRNASLTVVINGEVRDDALEDLQKVVCDEMVGDLPDDCLVATPAKVNVQFHYSAKDHATQRYVLNELYPNYRDLEEIVNLDIVPYGLMELEENEDGSYELRCLDGEDECHANVVHACVLNKFWNDDLINEAEFDGRLQTINFLKCYFGHANYPGKATDIAQACVQGIFGLDEWWEIFECIHDETKVKEVLEVQRAKVDELIPPLTYQPWITLDHRHSYALEHHLRKTICNTYQGAEKPPACAKVTVDDGAPIVVIHYEPRDVRSRDFFTTQFDLTATHVNEVAEIVLVPFGRAQIAADGTVTCRNENDCHHSRLHACVMRMLLAEHKVETLKFLACTFGKQFDDDENVVNECMNQVYESEHYDRVNECARASEEEEPSGLRYLKENGERVSRLSPNLTHVPWILINDEHNLEAEENLAHETCVSYYPQDKPSACLPKLIDVDVYYQVGENEIGFALTEQLANYRGQLNEMGNIGLVPFGLTKLEGNQCAATDDNCHANMIHSCVINRFYNKSIVNLEPEVNQVRTIGFMLCSTIHLETEGKANKTSAKDLINHQEECFNHNFDAELWRTVHDCFTSQVGVAALLAMKTKTEMLKPALSSLPTITIASKPIESKNVLGTLCNTYGVVKPAACATLPTGASQVGVYFSANKAGRDFFVNQMLPIYKQLAPVVVSRAGDDDEERSGAKLHTILIPTLVPYGAMVYNNETGKFQCDADNECFLTRLLACASYFHESEPRARLHLVEFTVCIFSHEKYDSDPGRAANECANHIWMLDSYPELDVCAKGTDEGSIAIALAMKRKTDLAQVTAFPAVTINNRLDEEAVSKLLDRVCGSYQGADKPSECAQDSTDSPTVPVDPSQPTVPVDPTQPTVPADPSQPTVTAEPTKDPIETSSKPSGFAFSRHALPIELLVALLIISFLTILY